MADTLQIVSWALERKCNLRSGDHYYLPSKTQEQLSDFIMVARAHTDDRVVNGICVTGWTTGDDKSGNVYDIPCSGFFVDKRLGRFGGIKQVQQICGTCEANVESKLATRIAGCFGHIEVWPNSEELDAMFWKVIGERRLEDRLRSVFHVTAPLWYGFWIDSPLRRPQCELLYELFDAVCDYESETDDGTVHFIHALKAAMDSDLPLHVSLSPLGHTDLGWYTVFPHCPRCKAIAAVGRWQEKFSNEDFECEVCGHIFDPDENHRMERMDHDWEASSLKIQLGESEHEDFVRQFLAHRGCSAEQIEEVIDNERNGPLLRQIAKVRRQRKAQIRQLRAKRKVLADSEKLPQTISIALNDSVEMEFVQVPAGDFMMGALNAEECSNESPQHLVTFERPFYIGRFLVTQSQWRAIMGATKFRHEHPDLPIDQLSWFDCQKFCKELSKRQQRVFRLPSEAEWEYACRAGTTTRFAFGDTLSTKQANFTPMNERFDAIPENELEAVSELEKLAESDIEQRSKRDAKPTLVGSYPPNAWGVYDMHGNVDEWCEDVWHENYENAPTDGSAWLVGEEHEAFRVMRGGWCSATEFVCTSTSRRQLRTDAGARPEPSVSEGSGDADDDGFLSSIFEMMHTPYGFRVVYEG